MVSIPLQVGNKGKMGLGAIVDVEFPEALPGIYNALTVEYTVQNQPAKVTLEVQQHLGDKWVRAISMSGTEGLKRGFEVTARRSYIHARRRRRQWAGCST